MDGTEEDAEKMIFIAATTGNLIRRYLHTGTPFFDTAAFDYEFTSVSNKVPNKNYVMFSKLSFVNNKLILILITENTLSLITGLKARVPKVQ